MIRQPVSRGLYVALGVSSFITLGVLYTILSSSADTRLIPTWKQIYQDGVVPVFFPRIELLPSFEWDETQKKLVKETREKLYPPLIWVDGKATLWRLCSALAWAIMVGVPLGILMGCYHGVEAYFLPPFSFLAKIPATAMLAVFMASCTTVFQFYMAIIMFGLIPILAQTVFRAAKEDVPEELLFKARTLGASQANCVWDVIFKFILPNVMEVVRLLIGPAIVYLMAAEWARGEDGFGCRMRLLMKSLDMSITFTYLIVLGVGGLVVDNGLVWLRRKLFPWYAAQ